MASTKYTMSTSRLPAEASRRALLSEFHHHRQEPVSARCAEDTSKISDKLQLFEDVWSDCSGNSRFEEVFGEINTVELRDMLSRWYVF